MKDFLELTFSFPATGGVSGRGPEAFFLNLGGQKRAKFFANGTWGPEIGDLTLGNFPRVRLLGPEEKHHADGGGNSSFSMVPKDFTIEAGNSCLHSRALQGGPYSIHMH